MLASLVKLGGDDKVGFDKLYLSILVQNPLVKLVKLVKLLGDGVVTVIRRTGCDRQAKAALSCLGS